MKKDPSRKPIPYKCFIGDEEYSFSSVVPYLLNPEKDPGLAYNCPPKYESVRQLLTYEFRQCTHDVETSSGKAVFYSEIYEIYIQLDQTIPFYYKYRDARRFAIEVIPQYLLGGESEKYIEKYIIPLFPETMKKKDRDKAIKAKIKEEFKGEKGYPRWVQASEWPLDKEGKPCTYIGEGRCEGDFHCYTFRDEKTGKQIVIKQYN